jgi:MYXO-CTERM domain-containing protein
MRFAFAVWLLSVTAYAYPSLVASNPYTGVDYECTDCHISNAGGGSACPNWPCHNEFGRAYRLGGWTGTTQGQNSDGDGTNNDPELPNATSAGFHNSAVGACGLSGLETCAFSGSAVCSNNVRCTGTLRTYSFSSTTYNYYTFAFSCAGGTSGTTSGNGTWGCCSGGFFWNGSSCQDIDECSGGHDCDTSPVAACNNTSGGFDCDCPTGYSGSGHGAGGCTMCPAGTTTVGSSTTCTNIDECAANPCGPGSCSETSLSGWTAPGYTCACNSGYEFNGSTCVNIDECARGTDDCTDPPAGICTDEIGSFTCTCNTPAFMGATGRDCVDVDECSMPVFSNMCSSVATCVNTFGSWGCVCNPGYEGDGFTCVDIDECMRMTDDCDINATCGNTVGAFTCTCNPNWEGSGVDCSDVNECTRGTGGCGVNEACVNQIGAPNTCVCQPGYSRPSGGGNCAIICGDSTRGIGEQCDDGNTNAGDGCSATCTLDPGWTCYEPAPFGQSACSNTCGNGRVETNEQCDTGANNSDTVADACRVNCSRARCGDNVVDSAEACDDGATNSDTVANACRVNCQRAYCGDGVVDTGELCDRGGGSAAGAIAGACTTMCGGDAGVDSQNPPVLTGGACGCRAAPNEDRAAWAIGIAIALVWMRRRRRS